MTPRSVSHTSFVIERRLQPPPGTVFRAWAEPERKRRWSLCHENTEHSMSFGVGGTETSRVALPDGTTYLVQAHYLDIIEGERIIYAYSMQRGETPLSASLVTVQLEPDGTGTRMTYTEHAAFLDGHDDHEERIRGTEGGLDRLELELRADVEPE